MHIISICNKKCPGLELWEKTARLQKLNPVVLGLDDKRELGHESEKFGLKFLLLSKYLLTLPPTDMCLVTDGFDVIFYQCENLEQRLRKEIQASELLFAADVFENPDQGNPYKTRHYRAPYLNSGVYAGRVDTILHVLQGALSKNEHDTLVLDDQRYFTQYMFKYPGKIRIDHACAHFACTAGLEYLKDFYVKKSANVQSLEVLSGSPCILHFQGFYKDTRIINELFPLNEDIKLLGRKLLRRPSPWGKAIGDFLVKCGSLIPVTKQYQIHAGSIILLLLLCSLYLSIT